MRLLPKTSTAVVVIITTASLLTGCAHTQLRWNTTHQAKTLTDIYEQQVLDNLAMFVHDPNSLPSFAYPNAGRSDVTDRGAIGSDATWNRVGFATELLKLSSGRDMYETWGFTPVHDVRRLELMRCAYQDHLWKSGIYSASSDCPNCDKIQRAFYLGDPGGRYATDEQVAIGYPDDLSTFSNLTGRTSPACFCSVSWLAFGDRKSVPKGNRCLKKGHYCGTYVWLCDGGQDELTKLTLTILDYAFSPQAPKPPAAARETKEVTWFFDKNGDPVSQYLAAQIIKATVPANAVVRLGEGAKLPGSADLQKQTESGWRKEREDRDPVDRALRSVQSPDGVHVPAPRFILPPIQQPRAGISPLELELQLRNPQGN